MSWGVNSIITLTELVSVGITIRLPFPAFSFSGGPPMISNEKLKCNNSKNSSNMRYEFVD